MEGLSDSEQIVQDVCSRMQGYSGFLPNSPGLFLYEIARGRWRSGIVSVVAQRYMKCIRLIMTKETHKFLGPGALNSPRGAVGLGLPVLGESSHTTRSPESPGHEPPGGRTHIPTAPPPS